MQKYSANGTELCRSILPMVQSCAEVFCQEYRFVQKDSSNGTALCRSILPRVQVCAEVFLQWYKAVQKYFAMQGYRAVQNCALLFVQ